jgi:hypothetical protein
MSASNYSGRVLQPQDIKNVVDMVDLGNREAAAFSMINASQRTPGTTSAEHIDHHANDNGAAAADLAMAQGAFNAGNIRERTIPLSMP